MNVWLLLGGDYAAPEWRVGRNDVVIAVDGGMRHAAELNVTPNVWIGDFDSVDAALQQCYHHVTRQTHPTDKDATDFELALAYVRHHYPQAGVLSIIGGMGDELDHSFANVWVLASVGLSALLWGRWQHIAYLNSAALSCHLPHNSTVSVFALTPLAGMHYDGLRWAAPPDGLQPFSARGARNSSIAHRIRIAWQHGHGLIVLPQDMQAAQITAHL